MLADNKEAGGVVMKIFHIALHQRQPRLVDNGIRPDHGTAPPVQRSAVMFSGFIDHAGGANCR